VACRSRREGCGFGRCSPFFGRPRFFGAAAGGGGSTFSSFGAGFSRASISVASPGDDADDAPFERPLNERGVHPCGQIALRELAEGSGKSGFMRNLGAPLEAADATQRLVGPQAFDQGARGWNAKQSLGDEASGEGAAIRERTAGAARRFGNEGAETDHVENGDEPAELFGHRLDFFAKPREKRGLNVIPARPHGVERIVAHTRQPRRTSIDSQA